MTLDDDGNLWLSPSDRSSFAVPAGVEVGAVDKFQGREAPIVVFSMATSTGEDAPRDLGFLFSKNRLNVASRRTVQPRVTTTCRRSLPPCQLRRSSAGRRGRFHTASRPGYSRAPARRRCASRGSSGTLGQREGNRSTRVAVIDPDTGEAS